MSLQMIVAKKLNEEYAFEKLEFLHENIREYFFRTENGCIIINKETKEIILEGGHILGQLK